MSQVYPPGSLIPPSCGPPQQHSPDKPIRAPVDEVQNENHGYPTGPTICDMPHLDARTMEVSGPPVDPCPPGPPRIIRCGTKVPVPDEHFLPLGAGGPPPQVEVAPLGLNKMPPADSENPPAAQ